MSKQVLFPILILFLSCSKESSNSITLFNSISFEIRTGEIPDHNLFDINDLYTTHFNNRLIQIPLFKYISHPEYKIFIGIPYDTSINEIVMSKSQITDSCCIDYERNSVYFFIRYKKDRFFITEYARLFDNGNIVYISTMTGIEELSNTLFNKFNISERLKNKD
jgi:hypothetical protein